SLKANTPHGAYYDTITSDPMTGKVYVFPSYTNVTAIYEYPTLADFKANTNVRTIKLGTAYEGTSNVVLGGHNYYAANNSNTLVRAQASDGAQLTTATLTGAGFHNQSYFNWGGYSDIDFYVDGVANTYVLYVVYAPSGGGTMRIRSVDPNDLSL